MIKAVLFDYGGVLSPGGKSFKVAAAELLNIHPDEVQTESLGRKLWTGEIDSDQFFSELSQLHGKQITTQEFLRHSAILNRNEAVYKIAEDLRAKGIKTAILSNMYGSSADLLRAGGYYQGFEPIILSYQEGLSKPDPAFYEIAIKELGCQPEEILFIDDQVRFIGPAQQLGLQTITAVSEDQIVADIRRLLKVQNGIEL